MSKFCGTDDHRPAMTGVYLNGKGNLSVATTDGHRLYSFDSEVAIDGDVKHIVPASVFKALGSSLSGDIIVDLSSANASFSDGVTSVVTRLIDERYPDYKNVMPTSNDKIADFLNSELQSALSRVLLCANKTTYQVRLKFSTDGTLTIQGEDLDYSNEASDVLDLINYDGEEMEIGFNGKLLLDVLKSLGSSVKMKMSLPNRAALFFNDQDESKTLLLMPVMLNQNS
jgi:DNA polymerase-3 subunit beta